MHPEIEFQGMALMALQEASNHFLIQLFSGANECAKHAGRVFVNELDL